ncbi:hypothetical protein EYZ11_013396 [Aspergillus tanneri]|uniref:Uncharacterized protein n=1 Tax=Aspergillus tanneri TaxID=1220188 RepID=A0A4S3J372_9EURO|nr:hypothetical protein EYZ11_013396 [Aspergillus tanneri]
MGIVASAITAVFKPTLQQRLLRSLRGGTFVIPDLEENFAHWPQDISPDVNRLAKEVNRRLDQFFPGDKIASKLHDAGVAVFGACWWPYAPLDRLCFYTAVRLG